MSDKKIISAIINRDEQMLAFVVQKYSKLLWKIAAEILDIHRALSIGERPVLLC